MSFKPHIPRDVPPRVAARLETDGDGAENNQEKE